MKNYELFCEALLLQSTKNQLLRIKNIITSELGGDSGEKAPKQKGPGIAYKSDYFKNAIDTNLDTFEDYIKEPFKVNQNIKKYKK